MCYTYITKYSQAAINFANSKDDNNILFTAKNGSVYKFNKETNEFIIISRNVKIVAYFEPDRCIDYFYEQAGVFILDARQDLNFASNASKINFLIKLSAFKPSKLV